MPSLPKPRLRRTARTRAAVGSPTPENQAPQVETIDAGPEGRPLRWINVESWRPAERAWLEEHFEFHQLDRIVDDSVDASFPMLRKMGNKLERLEDDIFEGRSNEVVRDIFDVKQEIINFRKTVRPMRTALSDLERTTKRYVPEDLEMYF